MTSRQLSEGGTSREEMWVELCNLSETIDGLKALMELLNQEARARIEEEIRTLEDIRAELRAALGCPAEGNKSPCDISRD